MPERVKRGAPNGKGPQGKKIAGMNKNTALLVGGGGALILALFIAHRRNAASQTTTDPTQGGTIDPATGVPYAQEYANMGMGGGYGGGFGSGFGSSSSMPSLPPALPDPATDPATQTPAGTQADPLFMANAFPPMTNNDWSAKAITALESQGYTTAAAHTAVYQYLLGLPLTSTEEGAISAAAASVGLPPNPLPVSIVGSTAGSNSSTAGKASIPARAALPILTRTIPTTTVPTTTANPKSLIPPPILRPVVRPVSQPARK